MFEDGQGVLAVERGARGSIVTRAVARSPLRILTPGNHGHGVWAYLSSFGGGLVDGDAVDLRVDVGAGAAAMISTQASTKVYRGGAGQRVRAEVGDGGLLVVLPDPVVCFAGARLAQSLDVRLGEDARLIVVDAFTCGRAARGERWAFAGYRSAIEVRRGERVILRDVVELDPAAGALPPRMGRFDALATIVAIGAELAPPPAPARGAACVSVRSPIEGGAVIRAAAIAAEPLHAAIRAALSDLPQILGDDPFARKY